MARRLRSADLSEVVNGTSYSLTTYVHVEWPWLVLPAALVLLSFPFLIVTIVQSARAKLKPWKTSTMAVFQGLGNRLRGELGALDTESSMQQKAESLSAQLVRDGNGWRLE